MEILIAVLVLLVIGLSALLYAAFRFVGRHYDEPIAAIRSAIEQYRREGRGGEGIVMLTEVLN